MPINILKSLREKKLLIVCWLTAILIIFLGIIPAVKLLQQELQIQTHNKTLSQIVSELDNYINVQKKTLNVLSKDSAIINLLRGISSPDNPTALAVLTSTKKIIDASIVYALDSKGIVIGCSPYDNGKTLTGNNYEFRPYFQKALSGNDVVYPALGITTLERGIYLSKPVFDDYHAGPIGVIVIKIGLKQIDHILSTNNYPELMVSPEGIIFAGNRPDWLYKTTVPVTKKLKSKIEESRQFADKKLVPLNIKIFTNSAVINNKPYYALARSLSIKGWQVYSFFPKNAGNGTKLSFPIKIIFFSFFLIAVFLVTLLFALREKMVRQSPLTKIRSKLFFSIGISIIFIIAGSLLTIHLKTKNILNNEAASAILEVNNHFKQALDKDAEIMTARLEEILNNQTLQKLWMEKNRAELLEKSQPIFNHLHSVNRITHFYFHRLDKVNFLRVHHPQRFGDLITRYTLNESARTKKLSYGIELGPLGTFTLRVVHPWIIEGKLVGYVELGEEIDHITPLLKNLSNTDLIFLIKKTFVNRASWKAGLKAMKKEANWDQFKDFVIIDSTLENINLPLASLYTKLIKFNHPNTIFSLSLNNQKYRGGFISLKDVSGVEVGKIIVLKNFTTQLSDLSLFEIIFTLATCLLGSLLAAFFWTFLGKIEKNFNDHAEELRINEEKYRNLYNYSQDAIMILEPHKNFISGNPTTITMFECRDNEEFIQLGPADLSPEYQPDGELSTEKAKKMVDIAVNKGSHLFHWVHKSLKGREFDCTVFLNKITIEGSIFLQVTVRDISKEKKHEEELKKSAKEWENTFNSLEDLISIQDTNFTIMRVNKAFCAAFKKSPAELIGKKCYEVVHGTNEPWPTCPQEKTLINKKYASVEMFEPNLGITLEVSTSPILDNKGELIGIVHIAKDITQRKEAEEEIKNALLISESLREDLEEARVKAENAANVKSQFLANMSHEIRTPMNAVLGFSDLLYMTELNEKQKLYLDTIHSSGSLLIGIINDILDISKIETGNITLESIDFELERLISELFNIMLDKLKDKPIETYININKDVPKWVNGDPTRLRQIILNLLTNAIKFTEKGSICITVSLDEGYTEEHPFLRFSIKDTGIGVPANKQKSIFEVFSQADTSTTRKYGGSGLGLSICKHLVELMNGSIWICSKEGQGSEFIFTIKLQKGKHPNEQNIYPLNREALQGICVFIVDDNETQIEIITNYCKEFNMKISGVATSAEETLSRLNELANQGQPPQVILSDVMMPNIDGYELTKRIRKQERFRNIKIIALSSDVRVGSSKEAELSGFNGYLTKPISKNSLSLVIATVLGDKRDEGSIITKYMANELSLKGIKILVAEDALPNQMLIKAYFEELGCSGDYVQNGQEAIDKLKENRSHYDMILMDLQMPILGGIKATEIIRKDIDKDIVIIALTATVLHADQERAFAAGMSDFLAKPITLSSLKKIILKYKK